MDSAQAIVITEKDGATGGGAAIGNSPERFINRELSWRSEEHTSELQSQ